MRMITANKCITKVLVEFFLVQLIAFLAQLRYQTF